MREVEKKLGNTRYILSEMEHGTNLKLSRIDGQGFITTIYFPEELMEEFMAEEILDEMSERMKEVLRNRRR